VATWPRRINRTSISGFIDDMHVPPLGGGALTLSPPRPSCRHPGAKVARRRSSTLYIRSDVRRVARHELVVPGGRRSGRRAAVPRGIRPVHSFANAPSANLAEAA
jgi:hypothetical protein